MNNLLFPELVAFAGGKRFQYIQFTKLTGRYSADCPFCLGKSSATIERSKGVWSCGDFDCWGVIVGEILDIGTGRSYMKLQYEGQA